MHIIQFIHPGIEFPVSDTNAEMRADGRYNVHWNTGKHYRRLVKHYGDYVDVGGVCQNAELSFWTEWEGPTTATRLADTVRDAIHARYQHTIQCPAVPEDMLNTRRERCDDNNNDECEEGLQNTDPCIFGDSFKYCCCQQSENGMLRWLEAGSLILFVSRILGEYYLDTVFVTGRGIEYLTDMTNAIVCSHQYRDLTLDRLPLGRNYTFYRGVGFAADAPIYSFVPSKIYAGAADDNGRCRLDVAGINGVVGCEAFSPRLTQKFKCTVADRDLIQNVWNEVVRQVRDGGFVPGVRFGWPRP